MLSVIGEEAARHTLLDGEHCYISMINQSFVSPVLADAAAARHTISSNITLQPSCPSTHSLCCAEHSCSMAWPSSNPEPSPKLAPQQQMKSSPSAGFPQTLCSQAVLPSVVALSVHRGGCAHCDYLYSLLLSPFFFVALRCA